MNVGEIDHVQQPSSALSTIARLGDAVLHPYIRGALEAGLSVMFAVGSPGNLAAGGRQRRFAFNHE